MDNPMFRLEGVVKTKGDMEDFEGPLALILQLLSKNKIEIKDIQISLLLEQYLEYLEDMKAMDLEVASEFVAMASHLVYIKARKLLDSDEEISELEQLISSLENLKAKDSYIQIQAVTDRMQEMFRSGAGTYTKPPEYLEPDKEYKYSHTAEDLLEAIQRVNAAAKAEKLAMNTRPFFVPKRIVYPVTQKAEEIISLLKQSGTVRLNAFFNQSETRSELVATFVAVLELCKDGNVLVSGSADDLIISAIDINKFDDNYVSSWESEDDGDT